MSKRKKYIFGSLFVLIILLPIILYFIFKEDKVEEVAEIITKEEKLSFLDIESDDKTYKLAQEKKEANLCLSLKNNISKSLCINEVSSTLLSTSSCALIAEPSAQEACVSNVVLGQAVLDKDLLACENFSENILSSLCIKKIAEIDPLTNCESIKNFDLWFECSTVIKYDEAKNKKDYKLCANIPSAIIRANCLSELNNIDLNSDTDKDGLSYRDEILNNTNPDKADSDNDSYLDADEIKAGFDPTGSGEAPKRYERCSEISDKEIVDLCKKEFKNEFIDYQRCFVIKEAKLLEYCMKKGVEIKK